MSDQSRYSLVATINHWVTALLIVVMLALGLAAGAAPAEDIEDYVLGVHISLGFFVFVFIAWRVLFRLCEGFPQNIGETAFERRAAYITHRAILILLVVQIITGPLYLFTENECMNVFGSFSICLPLASLSMLHDPAEWFHVNIGTYLLPAVLIFHFMGAVRHYANRKRQETPSDM